MCLFLKSWLWLEHLDQDWTAVDGFEQMAGGGDCFGLVVAWRISLGRDCQDLVLFF
jgi:hypothetical protein